MLLAARQSWVMAEVAKKNLMNGSKLNIHFWRKTDGSEIDIVLRGTDIFKAYEVKWSKQGATRGTKAFANTYGVPVERVTRDTVLDLL